MKSTAENLSPTRVRLAVEVPFEELKPSLDAAYKKLGSQMRIPGFRPGKVPARVIDQRVGRSAVLEEAINEVLPAKYVEAAREHDIRALGQPDVEVTNLSDNESFSFTAEVDIRPEITLPDFSTFTIEVDDVEVADSDVDEQLDSLRERFATLTGVERAVETGDYVSIDLLATVGGEEVADGSVKGMSYEVGAGDLIDGLDDALVGVSAGETATFTTTLQQGEKAGEEAEIAATVNSVKSKELPVADDEFAQMASEFDTIAELREDIRDRVSRVKALEQGAQARDKLVAKMVETIEFPLPESAVKAEVEYREHDVIHSLGHDDELFERYLGLQGKTREEFTAELTENAEQSVRAQLILDAVAEQTEVQVGDSELTEYLVRQAQRYNMPPQDFANQVVESGNLQALVADVRRNKALAELLEAATITDASGNVVDLSALAPGALAELADGGSDEGDFDEHDHEGHDHSGHDHDHSGHDHDH
ncbi:MAG: Cell division trigger factor [Marmoricola sp.]|nr:Cell division trigger factor [Marmoricola sp.]